jgi:aspartyl-tRNA(Asn)/glutamyl-tRNA(Gln) amidotransferase subunit C
VEVTEDLVRHVARLARLELGFDEAAKLAVDLGRILAHVDTIAKVDVTGVDPAASEPVGTGTLREDVPAPGLSRDEALRGAPDHDGTFFRVPRVLDGD